MRDDGRPMLTVATFIRNLATTSQGSEIAEAAVVLPVVFLFIFAILWFGLAFNTWGTVTAAAREGARYAARPTCATCGPPVNGWSSTNLPGDAAVDAAVTSFLQAGRVDPTQIIAYQPDAAFLAPCLSPPAPPAPACSGPTAHNLTICRFVVVNFGDAPQQCGIIVSFQYPFGSGLPFPSYPNFSLQSIKITTVGSSQTQN